MTPAKLKKANEIIKKKSDLAEWIKNCNSILNSIQHQENAVKIPFIYNKQLSDNNSILLGYVKDQKKCNEIELIKLKREFDRL